MTADTKTALMDVAEQAARARGFDGFSYADLAEAVGIRKASVHHHFPTKAALSVALMQRYHDKLSGECARIDTEHATAGGRLKALAAVYKGALNDGRTLCLCVALIGSRESLTDEVLNQIKIFRAMMIDWIAAVYLLGKTDGTIADVTDPVSEAHSTLALLEGAHLAARAEEDLEMFDRATASMLARCRTVP